MKTENIENCINITGNAGHKVEHRRAKQELEELKNAHASLVAALEGMIEVASNGQRVTSSGRVALDDAKQILETYK